MIDSIEIKQACLQDIPALQVLYEETLRTINSFDYSEEEIEDWVSCGNDISRWEYLLSTMHFIVAVNVSGELVGFAAINHRGFLNSLFVHKDRQHCGVGTMLLDKVELYARKKDLEYIEAEVSITVYEFFLKHGFQMIDKFRRPLQRCSIINYHMRKYL